MNTASRIASHLPLAAGMLAAFSISAVAMTDQPEGRMDISRYESAAGRPVDSAPFGSLVDWQPVGDHSLAIWTASDQPWLVGVEPSCDIALSKADDVAFTTRDGKLESGRDRLEVGGRSCKIASIRPIDYGKVATHARR